MPEKKSLFPKLLIGFILILFFFAASAEQKQIPYSSSKPLSVPEVFAPGIISQGDHESHPAFTPDGKELYFLKNMPDFSFWTIVVSRYINGQWSEPEVASFSGQYSDADPFITADGRRLYFISNRPLKNEKKEDLDSGIQIELETAGANHKMQVPRLTVKAMSGIQLWLQMDQFTSVPTEQEELGKLIYTAVNFKMENMKRKKILANP